MTWVVFVAARERARGRVDGVFMITAATSAAGALLRRGPSFTCRGRARAAQRDVRAAAVLINAVLGS